MNIAILGRQHKIGLAELESLCGANIVPIGTQAALFKGSIDPGRLGGVVRIASPLAEIASTDWRTVAVHSQDVFADYLAGLPDGKVKLGISVFGLRVGARQLFATSLEFKKVGRANGRSLRVIPSASTELNSAQVLHNNLTGELGIELVFVTDGSKTWIGRTTWVQDINAYATRDYGRPHRDPFVGMLPPKLAQTMLNLAQAQPGKRILDPFCGTGVVLQEAALLGCDIYGTDINERMVRYTRDNLTWLQDDQNIHADKFFEVADATTHTWRPPLDHVVCETYLGQPLNNLPSPQKLAQIIQGCNAIVTKFLKNLYPQLTSGTRLCIAVPAWYVSGRLKHLRLLDHLEDLGYNRVRFRHAQAEDMIYRREDQIVARELLVITSK